MGPVGQSEDLCEKFVVGVDSSGEIEMAPQHSETAHKLKLEKIFHCNRDWECAPWLSPYLHQAGE